MRAFVKSVWVYLNDPGDAYTRLEAIRDTFAFGAFIGGLYLIAAVASTFVLP